MLSGALTSYLGNNISKSESNAEMELGWTNGVVIVGQWTILGQWTITD